LLIKILMNFNNYFKFLFQSILNFINPKLCTICKINLDKTNTSSSDFLCKKCYYSLPIAPESSLLLNQIFHNINKEDLYFENVYALYRSDDEINFINLIHLLKYKGVKRIGYEFGKLLAKKVSNESNKIYDLVIPLPIHIAKKRERGYNQSDFIAKGFADELNLSYDTKLAKRRKYTKSQTTLSAEQRITNVVNVFAIASSQKIINKNIIIIDDVLTTGSTLNNLAKSLKESGAKSIDAAVLYKA